MIDDKLLKSILDSQKALRSCADIAESVTCAAQPILESLHIYEENSTIRQMIKEIERREASMSLMFGPMWYENLEKANKWMYDIGSPFIHGAEGTRQALSAFESRFYLPEKTEIWRLISEYKSSPISEALAMHASQAAKLQQAMESMCTPWLDSQKTISSITGFAELQGIGHALLNKPVFDENLAASLRVNLGDWRDPIAWRPEIFTDLSARFDFYANLGFNPALTDFPMPAFEQGLDLAGFRREPLPVVDRYRIPIPPPSGEDEVEEGLSRTNAAHGRLLRFETRLRAFIEEQMTLAFGTDWPKHCLPNNMFDQWQDKKRKAEQTSASERPVVAYADFTDYVPVICRRDNWDKVFVKFFRRPECVRESFQRLYPIRVDTMHSRLITQEDELFLYVETFRLEKAIKPKSFV